MINEVPEAAKSSSKSFRLDRIDARILLALTADARVSVTELAARLGLSRNTVQAHLLRLERHDLLGYAAVFRQIAAAGRPLTAFVTVDIAQHDFPETASALRAIPEVIEVHAVAGDGDLWCRVVADGADDLGRVLDRVGTAPGVNRTRTSLAIREAIPCRADSVLALVAQPDQPAEN
jgi:DNA-binding Lrp family transcriptional regulator